MTGGKSVFGHTERPPPLQGGKILEARLKMLEIGGFICRHEPGSQTFPTLVDIGVGEILSFTCFISSPANHGVCAFFFPFSERDRPCQKS